MHQVLSQRRRQTNHEAAASAIATTVADSF
jgi:hypothetical protein